MPVGYNYRPDKHKVQIDKCSFVILSIPVQGQGHRAGMVALWPLALEGLYWL